MKKMLFVRIALYCGGLITILACTAQHFDWTEWTATALFAVFVAASETYLRISGNGSHAP